MIRALVLIVLVVLLAVGGVWLAERPGTVQIDWLGTQVEASLIVAALAVLVTLAALGLVWWLISGFWRVPAAMARNMRDRRRQRRETTIEQGLYAVASGDLVRGRRIASEARRLAPDAPLSLLLTAQAAQLDGQGERANEAFRAMLGKPETRLLGLRGLFNAARRDGDAEEARRLAQEAFDAAPHAQWSSRALIEAQGTERDWSGALETLSRLERAGVLDRPTFSRQRAVLLTAQAIDREADQPESAASLADEALRLVPDLVPAACVASRRAIERGDIKRAVKVLERAWKGEPHPDLAELYGHVRTGDTAQDRLARVRKLTRGRANHEEGFFALARACVEAQEWREAREALAPLLRGRPQARVSALMAEIEMSERGDEGRAREWLSRALRAAPDPAWTADGYVSKTWLPVSPVTGAIDAFRWKVPVEAIGGPAIDAEGERFAAEALAPPAPRRPEAEDAHTVEETPLLAAAVPMVEAAPSPEIKPVVVEPDPVPSPQTTGDKEAEQRALSLPFPNGLDSAATSSDVSVEDADRGPAHDPVQAGSVETDDKPSRRFGVF